MRAATKRTNGLDARVDALEATLNVILTSETPPTEIIARDLAALREAVTKLMEKIRTLAARIDSPVGRP